MDKERKTINISLQSRKFNAPMNKMFNEWEEEGLNISLQVCKTLLRMDELEHSGTMLKVLNLFELAMQTAKLYDITDKELIESILAKAIKIEPTVITELFLNPENVNREIVETTEYNVPTTIKSNIQPKITESSVEAKTETEAETEQCEDEPFFGDSEIPLDFLLNG